MQKLTKIGFLIAVVSGMSNAAWADKACFTVEGMTCATCPLTVKSALKKIEGVQTASASLEKKSSEVTFDPARTNAAAIGNAINTLGYKATAKPCKSPEG